MPDFLERDTEEAEEAPVLAALTDAAEVQVTAGIDRSGTKIDDLVKSPSKLIFPNPSRTLPPNGGGRFLGDYGSGVPPISRIHMDNHTVDILHLIHQAGRHPFCNPMTLPHGQTAVNHNMYFHLVQAA